MSDLQDEAAAQEDDAAMQEATAFADDFLARTYGIVRHDEWRAELIASLSAFIRKVRAAAPTSSSPKPSSV